MFLFISHLPCSSRLQTWKECPINGEWDQGTVSEITRDFPVAAHPAGAGGPTQNLWRYPRPVLWPAALVWVWWFPSRIQLFVPWRLCGSREAVLGDHLPVVGIQNQVSWELLPSTWQPWVCLHQSDLWLLWRMQEALQHQTVEDVYRLLQLLACGCHCWWKDLLLPWWAESWSPVYGTNPAYHATYRCAWSRPPLRFALVWSRQRHDGLGREWQRSQLHIWCRSGGQVPSQARYGSYMQGSSGMYWFNDLYLNYCQSTVESRSVVKVILSVHQHAKHRLVYWHDGRWQRSINSLRVVLHGKPVTTGDFDLCRCKEERNYINNF